MGNLFNNYEEACAIILFGIGFTTLLLNRNLIKKIIGFSMMDNAIYLFLAAKGYIAGRKAPIIADGVTSAEAYINPVPAGLVAVIIVLAMNLVGSLLISALIIFPAMSAMRVFKSFRSVTVCSAVLSVFCALTGILVSVVAGTPTGSTIVAVDIAAFLVFCAIAKIRR